MNRVTISKYSDMKQIAGNVTKALKDLNDKYKCLRPYLDQIDQVEDSVTKLEQAAYKLDAYSKRLGNDPLQLLILLEHYYFLASLMKFTAFLYCPASLLIIIFFYFQSQNSRCSRSAK